jgi:hypothetical protein
MAFANYRVQLETYAQVGTMFVDTEDNFMSYLSVSHLQEDTLAKKRELLISASTEWINNCDKAKELLYEYQIALRGVERAFSLSKWRYFQNPDSNKWELVSNEQHWCQMPRHNLTFMQQTSVHDFVMDADMRSQMVQGHDQVRAITRLAMNEVLRNMVVDKERTDQLVSELERQNDQTLFTCWDCLVAFFRHDEHPPQQDHP